MSPNFPQNVLLNMSYNCVTEQLNFHLRISKNVVMIPGILTLNNVILSLQVTATANPTFQTVVLSADTTLFSLSTFVAVKYDFGAEKFSIKGVPTANDALTIQKILHEVSGTALTVPSVIDRVSDITFMGEQENGVTTIAMSGKTGKHSIVILLQKFDQTTTAAVIANLVNFKLSNLVSPVLNTNIHFLER